jgi:hypothetical protein
MKFYPPSLPDENTRAMRIAYQKEWADYVQAHIRHIETLRGFLPAAVIDLAELRGVEDGLLVLVTSNRAEGVLTLTLRCGDLVMGYYDLVLQYKDAEMTPADERALAHLARSTVSCGDFDADLSRHEVDTTAEGKIEHRLEFHSHSQPDIEVAIQCSALQWGKVNRPSRDLPEQPDRFPGGPVTDEGRLFSPD